jgi:hypothetical protein
LEEIDREHHHSRTTARTHLPRRADHSSRPRRNRLAVVDDTGVIAETTWRPADNYRPGPATWDWALHRLGYDRRSAWQPEPLGFGCEVERITREENK